jgi:hypothetical protein
VAGNGSYQFGVEAFSESLILLQAENLSYVVVASSTGSADLRVGK